MNITEIASLGLSVVALVISGLAYKNSRSDRRQDLRIDVRELLDIAIHRAEELPQKLDDYQARMKSHYAYLSKLYSGSQIEASEEAHKFRVNATACLAKLNAINADLSKKPTLELEEIFALAKKYAREVEGIHTSVNERLISFEASEKDHKQASRDFQTPSKV
ncbi:hypothetical protein JQX09_05775 [Sulfitobacter pseudonitzschiae]|uniref:Uncharacterized protein n=1 Tax=Pseudosulfitobacter pseudonitzschiae TaxID=1402135 RepID=A0A9Q2NG02_9RHOB|nr:MULTISPECIES: hypothetical protein [Roseobacteraceae]MBM2291407.1 hypothetical protein [Pseudosulfitobacter pseudonitzschiae]MBM2296325.1 hypothetical protein [Pseudosulfitobacter pseudonitzschiae]MBM2301238.1 hypothetical protein [Pseudosulfitobacter pseudonitzschiae]MBM2311022.1 hypothetical protein [Pseudosulfitobacter pseudonitzschiae]MBM2315935.1 hypothetical protein [Pseudosulfitobacter pseudonitzschiae]